MTDTTGAQAATGTAYERAGYPEPTVAKPLADGDNEQTVYTDLVRLEQAFDRLDSEASMLGERLGPILVPPHPRSDDLVGPTVEQRPTSGVADRVVQMTNKLNRLRGHLGEIRVRVDLPETEPPF